MHSIGHLLHVHGVVEAAEHGHLKRRHLRGVVTGVALERKPDSAAELWRAQLGPRVELASAFHGGLRHRRLGAALGPSQPRLELLRRKVVDERARRAHDDHAVLEARRARRTAAKGDLDGGAVGHEELRAHEAVGRHRPRVAVVVRERLEQCPLERRHLGHFLREQVTAEVHKVRGKGTGDAAAHSLVVVVTKDGVVLEVCHGPEAAKGDKLHRADVAVLDEGTHLAEGRYAAQLEVAEIELSGALGHGGLQHLLRLPGVEPKGLLGEHVLPRAHRCEDGFLARGYRRRDAHEVNVIAVCEILKAVEGMLDAVLRTELLRLL
mmetsp:Transcript_25673/g.80359  ORF Transcript_25673/g.80359 Transcript_25673/m.80359 type:complete len:322 (-) Transcript_25673:193-1158(-)